MEMNPMVREKDGCEAEQASRGTVEFTGQARKAKGIYFTSGDGMARAMGLAEAIETRPDRIMTVTTIRTRIISSIVNPFFISPPVIPGATAAPDTQGIAAPTPIAIPANILFKNFFIIRFLFIIK